MLIGDQGRGEGVGRQYSRGGGGWERDSLQIWRLPSLLGTNPRSSGPSSLLFLPFPRKNERLIAGYFGTSLGLFTNIRIFFEIFRSFRDILKILENFKIFRKLGDI